jgi:hypothetical protein
MTDVVMPGTGGRALAEQLQSIRPEMFGTIHKT